MPDKVTWLADKSALVRLSIAADPDRWLSALERGLIRVAVPTILEVGFSARNSIDWTHFFEFPPLSRTPTQYVTPSAERRAIEVQGVLAERGEHRAPSMPDLMIAAIAETAGLTVLHVGKDFELIAEITEQPIERLILAEDPAE